jgi:hypothetical protein
MYGAERRHQASWPRAGPAERGLPAGLAKLSLRCGGGGMAVPGPGVVAWNLARGPGPGESGPAAEQV